MSVSIGDEPRAGHWLLLGAIFVVAILARVVAIDSQGLSTVEALAILQSDWSVGDMLLNPTDPTPFLYYALHKLLLPPDASLAAMRSISVVFGILSVGLIYILGRLAYGAGGGLLAAALLAVWSLPVTASQEAGPDSLLLFLTLLASVGFLIYAQGGRGERGPGWARIGLIMVGVGNVLGFYTHLVSLVWIALTSLMLVALVVRRRDRIGEIAVLFVAMALCAIPGVYRLIQQTMLSDGSTWLHQRGPLGFVKLCAEIFLPLGAQDGSSEYGVPASVRAAIMGAFAIGLGIAGWLGRRRLRTWLRAIPAVFWLILAYLLVPVVMWLYGFVAQPILIGSNILYAIPGIVLLIAGICLALDQRAAAWAGCAVVLLYGLSLLATGTIRERENWRAAYQYLAGAVAAGDVVAICPFHDFSALRYHATGPANVPVVTRVDGRTIEIEAKLGTDPRWDRVLFRAALYPHMTAWWSGGRAATPPAGAASTLDLKPGQSVWRVDGHCGDKTEDMDRTMSAAGYDPGLVRYQESPTILIRQYRVNAPMTLEIQDATQAP
jgi:hypothetical protein